jgi:hypothetical protein
MHDASRSTAEAHGPLLLLLLLLQNIMHAMPSVAGSAASSQCFAKKLLASMLFCKIICLAACEAALLVLDTPATYTT